jgi:hypothetical protein
MIELSPVELKLLHLLLDAGAQSGEAEVARRKLLAFLAQRGLGSHDIIEVLTNPQEVPREFIPPKMTRPDYGLCKMPFGPSSTVRKIELLSLNDLRKDERALALHFCPERYDWSSRNVGGSATPAARTAWEALAVS